VTQNLFLTEGATMRAFVDETKWQERAAQRSTVQDDVNCPLCGQRMIGLNGFRRCVGCLLVLCEACEPPGYVENSLCNEP
jgi:hypothetical protein